MNILNSVMGLLVILAVVQMLPSISAQPGLEAPEGDLDPDIEESLTGLRSEIVNLTLLRA